MLLSSKQKSLVMLLILILVLVLIAVSVILFVRSIYATVNEAMLSTMETFARHDETALFASIYTRWANLGRIGVHLKNSKEDLTLSEVSGWLDSMKMSSFKSLYLLTADGVLYTDDNAVGQFSQLTPNLFAEYQKSGGDTFFACYTNGRDAQNYTAIAYGAKIQPTTVEDVTFDYIFGIGTVATLQKEIDIVSFDGRGHTGLVSSDGYFVVNPVNVDSDMRDSLLQSIRNNTPNGQALADEVEQKLKSDEEYYYNSYINDNGEKIHFFLRNMQQVNYAVCLEVKDVVFVEKLTSYLTPAFVFLAVVIVAIFGLLVVYYLTRRDAMKTQAMADAKTEFLSTMSHEIRTPLNGIIGLNYLMKKHMHNNAKMEKYIDETYETSQYLLSLVNDILDFSKLNSGKFSVYEEPYNVKTLVDNICAMQRDNAADRKIRFKVNANITCPWTLGDETRIKQVLMNIIGNAMKFTSSGGEITFSTEQTVDETSVTTVFTVKDTGCGMSEGFLEHIFEAFSQEHNRYASEQKGTGLGMAISYLLVKQMGGDIVVTSKLGVGSIFTVTLPSQIADAQEEASAETNDASLANMRVLVAEDNELNMMILTEILSNEGILVDCATNGKECVDMFSASEENHYDAILMDMQMPVMDGCEATRKIRKLQRSDAKSITIFACTANSFPEDLKQIYDSGMSDYLPKPINVNTLWKKLREIQR